MNNNPFFIPNMDKNVKLKELPNGIEVSYILSCNKNYPLYTFESKGKKYVERKMFIAYTNNMSNQILKVYKHLKNSTMLELNLWNFQKLSLKIQQLQNNLNQLNTL